MAKKLTKVHPRVFTGTGDITADSLNLNDIPDGNFLVYSETEGKFIPTPPVNVKNIEADTLDLSGIPDGNYLIYDAELNRFVPTSSTVSAHTLLGNQHSDTDTSVTPSYGDSIYYNGIEWTTGNFGNFGGDFQYVGINGASNVTYTDLLWSDINTTDVGNHYAHYFGEGGISTVSTIPAIDNDSVSSGTFTPGILEQTTPNSYNPNEYNSSRIGFSSWNSTYGVDDNVHTLSCSIQFPLSDLEGTALVNENIRGLYIRVHNWISATEAARESKMYITYPDGTKKPLLVKDMIDANPQNIGSTEFVALVPVNEGQTEIEIDISLNRQGAGDEGLEFEIIGVQCIKNVGLSPDIDFIQIKGSKADDDVPAGYVDSNSDTNEAANHKIWYSENSTVNSQNSNLSWSDVLPLVIPNNVSKTVIRGRYNWNGISSLEEMSFVEVIIDWNAKTVYGNNISNYELGSSSFLPKQQIVDDSRISFIDYGHNAVDSNISIKISGRSIIELPWPRIQAFNANYADIYIENYKTIADATTKLNSAPHFNTRIADANNLTNPSQFANLNFNKNSGEAIIEFKTPSYGSPTVLHYDQNNYPMRYNSICWTMKVNVLSTTMINQLLSYVDDYLYIYVDGVLKNEATVLNQLSYGYDSGIVPFGGTDDEWYSYELLPGEHIIQYVYNDAGNGDQNFLMVGDIISDTVEFVNGDYIDISTP